MKLSHLSFMTGYASVQQYWKVCSSRASWV